MHATALTNSPHGPIAPFGTYPPTRLQETVRRIGGSLPANWPGRRFAGWLRHFLQTTARRPIDVEVLGQRMRLRLKDNACERRLMVTPHFFDPCELSILRGMIRGTLGPDFQFVDLGANVGAYSVFVGHLAGPGARILAIEPQEQMLVRLRENIALNGLTVQVAPVAVADHNGEIEFAVDTRNFGFTSLHTARKGRGERRIVRLPARRLIDLVCEAGFTRIDALKADIEGAEDRAIIPFMEEAPRSLWPKLFIIENNRDEWERDCVAYLEQRGYSRVPTRGDLVLRREDVIV